jgi:hypothetical protein
VDKQEMNLKLGQVQKFIIWPLLFIVTALWNIPHTIASRYICEGLLLIVVLANKPNWKVFFNANKVLLIFFIYLIFQLLFFSTNYPLALNNFRAEWMHFILFSMIGAGTGLALGGGGSLKILFLLGIAFSIPLYIHLSLSLLKAFELGVIPWGYWGINEIHGDLGYTALQASILLFAYYFYQDKKKSKRLITLALIAVCVASPLLASSRGGTGFVLIALLLVATSYFFLSEDINIGLKNKIIGTLSALILITSIYQIGLMSDPNRWGGVISRLSIGLQGDPSDVYCNGITTLEDAIKSKGTVITPPIQKGLNSIVDGDGARVMAARSGAALTLDSPMGINQSKQAYQQAIVKKCNGQPAIFISHTHSAWIDTALAIGLPGAFLLLITLLAYAVKGYQALKSATPTVSGFGVALFTSSCIWIARGVLDSTQRDQMLEMQAFILAFLLAIILAKQTKLNECT